MKHIIKPNMIDTSKHFWDTFGHHETEVSANYLVRLAQKNGSWKEFTQKEIDEFSKHRFHFNKLLSKKLISKKVEDDVYSYTHEFITLCFVKNHTK